MQNLKQQPPPPPPPPPQQQQRLEATEVLRRDGNSAVAAKITNSLKIGELCYQHKEARDKPPLWSYDHGHAS